MTKEKLEKDVRTYLRQQFGLNGGGLVSCDLKKLLLGFAEPREKRIEELEKENAVLEKRIERAKECMKKLLFIINSDPANYNCKGLVQDAEDFIHNRTCNIRQQGQHCISETRCIMCDKEDGKVK